MKKIKILISVICIFAFLLCGAIHPYANDSNNSKADFSEFAPPVEDQGSKDDCLYYAILSTAGSYAKKIFNATDNEADFYEENLAAVAKNPDVHNFGEVLYKSIGCYLGNDYIITSVEFLSNRGEMYIKNKISENGAIVAAITVPQYKGLENETFYNKETNTFNYYGGKEQSFHAVSIVGWDDEAEVWICKNSYGKNFGNNGYFYLSYSSPIKYSAALEVSQISGQRIAMNACHVNNLTGYVYAINVRAYFDSTETIKVTVGNKIAFDGEVNLKNGCNLIVFDKPVKSGKITVEGNNISTAIDTVYCYTSLLSKNRLNVIHASDENPHEGITEIKELYVSAKTGNTYVFDENFRNHRIVKNSIDNCYYITPDDGYQFTESTRINILTDTNNSSQIDFDSGIDGRGRYKIVGQEEGSAFVKELNLLTDENGKIKGTLLTFDDGSVISVDSEIALFKDEKYTNPIDKIDGLEEYFADIKIRGYYSNNLTVKINGVATQSETETNGTTITVKVKISLPDITLKLFEGTKSSANNNNKRSENFYKLGEIFRLFFQRLFGKK